MIKEAPKLAPKKTPESKENQEKLDLMNKIVERVDMLERWFSKTKEDLKLLGVEEKFLVHMLRATGKGGTPNMLLAMLKKSNAIELKLLDGKINNILEKIKSPDADYEEASYDDLKGLAGLPGFDDDMMEDYVENGDFDQLPPAPKYTMSKVRFGTPVREYQQKQKRRFTGKAMTGAIDAGTHEKGKDLRLRREAREKARVIDERIQGKIFSLSPDLIPDLQDSLEKKYGVKTLPLDDGKAPLEQLQNAIHDKSVDKEPNLQLLQNIETEIDNAPKEAEREKRVSGLLDLQHQMYTKVNQMNDDQMRDFIAQADFSYLIDEKYVQNPDDISGDTGAQLFKKRINSAIDAMVSALLHEQNEEKMQMLENVNRTLDEVLSYNGVEKVLEQEPVTTDYRTIESEKEKAPVLSDEEIGAGRRLERSKAATEINAEFKAILEKYEKMGKLAHGVIRNLLSITHTDEGRWQLPYEDYPDDREKFKNALEELRNELIEDEPERWLEVMKRANTQLDIIFDVMMREKIALEFRNIWKNYNILESKGEDTIMDLLLTHKIIDGKKINELRAKEGAERELTGLIYRGLSTLEVKIYRELTEENLATIVNTNAILSDKIHETEIPIGQGEKKPKPRVDLSQGKQKMRADI